MCVFGGPRALLGALSEPASTNAGLGVRAEAHMRSDRQKKTAAKVQARLGDWRSDHLDRF